MKIAIGADHAGVKAKEAVKQHLKAGGHEVLDLGTGGEESVDYPDYARSVAEAVAGKKVERGVLICGTGIGMCMTANRTPGVRAALVTDAFTTEMSRRHNDANVMCAGARVLETPVIEKLVDLWLTTPFEGGRHQRRVDKIG